MLRSALIGAVLALQEPSGDPSKEVERLRKEVQELRERLVQAEQSALEDAQLIQRLRQLVKVLQEKAAALEATAPKPGPAGAEKPGPEAGPEKPIRTKVVYVDAKNGFLTLGAGQKEGVQPGYRFEIYRETPEPGGDPKLARLGMGEVEKFMGQGSMSKLLVKEGNTAEMKADDIAVAIRRLDPVAAPGPASGPASTPAAAPGPGSAEPKEGVYTITGRAGTGFILNYGGLHGAKQTDLVWAYRDGQLKAKLRLDKVDKQFSVANVVDSPMQSPPDQGDTIFVREPRKALSGKVALADDKRGMLAVDLRQRDGVKTGMKLEVRRLGQKVGVLTVTEVQSWGSWCKPEGDSKLEDFKKGDFVEAQE
jgi:hypothetical protein